MNKDFAFMFYPGDYLRDTQCLSEKSQVAYDRIMCEHMRNICITQQQLNFFTKRLSPDELNELMFVLNKIDSGYEIEWVVRSIKERQSYVESRRKNRQGKAKEDMINITNTYDTHMEGEGEYKDIINPIIEDLYNAVIIFFDKNFRPKDEKQKNKWYDVLDKLIRIDKKEPDRIIQVIKKARMDDFWRKNFMSILKLRKKNPEEIYYFDILENRFFGKSFKEINTREPPPIPKEHLEQAIKEGRIKE